ncbi:hypothetical protein UA08_03757 [Talaromyces atroroseus]|uniref:Uncharacterized protein n=1 Tax=Talaromyces atroroseus TaxID=1441469 RepID=A0A225AU57_TALAT|nr:hypothetical protein UA08_03757 [Talaromyces atroroseus]OKL60828.1 hypothetical protein UA08_03757 [Talaromyces atroroseus]
MTTIHDEALKGTLNKIRIARYRASQGSSFDIDEIDIRGRTALASAALKGHVNVVKALVEEHADVNKASRGNRTPLWYAASGTMPTKSRFDIITYLLDHDAEIDEPSDDGNTPLMKVIVEFRDPKVISLFVDRGANVNIPNSAKKTAKQLGDQTKDPQVIEALLPKDERGGTTGAFVQLIVSFLLFVVAWMNSDLVTGLVKGVAQQLYNITGEERPEVVDTVQDFKENISEFLKETQMNDFFAEDDDFLDQVAKKAVKLKTDPSTTLKRPDDIKNLTRLALYQPVIYCDDSLSMETDGRLDSQRQLVKRIARITTQLVPDGEGIELQFINHTKEFHGVLDAGEVEDLVSSIPVSGSTNIGTNLTRKILQPLVYNILDRGEKLKRPIIISVLTDGIPYPEKTDTFRDAIIECGKRLKQAGYDPTAVRFHISQIGTDSESQKFLDGLRDDLRLEDVLYVTAEQLDKQFEKFRDNEAVLEQWLLKLLMSPILDGAEE